MIPNLTMYRGIDKNDGDNCVGDDDDPQAITNQFEVVTLEKMWDLPYKVWVLGSANKVSVEGKGGG